MQGTVLGAKEGAIMQIHQVWNLGELISQWRETNNKYINPVKYSQIAKSAGRR